MNKEERMRLINKCLLGMMIALTIPVSAFGHAVSIGFENAGPGSVTVWLGTYQHGGHHLEGSMNLVGVSGNPFPTTTIPFSVLTPDGVSFKPAGLIDGVTNFYADWDGNVPNNLPLVDSEAPFNAGCPDCGPVNHWEGATFSSLGPGFYQFTYVPIAFPSAEWDLLSLNMNGIFDLSGVVFSDITLSPETATNPVGTTHTVTATVTSGSPPAPAPNVVVTFTVISGPNAGVTGTATTDAGGVATFTYTGSGGPGTDIIEATATVNDQEQHSNRVSKTWEQAECGNDKIEGSEECDGTSDAPCPDRCAPPGDPNECTCLTVVCGNNVVEGSEECDGTSTAACPGRCIPPGSPNECTCGSGCGDGIVQAGETCDPPGSIAGASGNICRADCTVCGDGIVQGGEQCDDGNALACDPVHPQKALDGCGNDCMGLMCKDPARIKLTDNLDVFKVHGRVVPIEGEPISFGADEVSISVTAGENMVFEASLPPGSFDLHANGAVRYRNAAALTEGGIYTLIAKPTSQDVYRLTVVAYGHAGEGATQMVTHVRLGTREWTTHGTWQRLATGWVLAEQ